MSKPYDITISMAFGWFGVFRLLCIKSCLFWDASKREIPWGVMWTFLALISYVLERSHLHY